MRTFFYKLRSLLHRRRKEEDLREELQFHLEEEVNERHDEACAAKRCGTPRAAAWETSHAYRRNPAPLGLGSGSNNSHRTAATDCAL